jgi:hypothetical protein
MAKLKMGRSDFIGGPGPVLEKEKRKRELFVEKAGLLCGGCGGGGFAAGDAYYA